MHCITRRGVAQMVACLNGVQEALSSNLSTPTKGNTAIATVAVFFLFRELLQNSAKNG